jgi:hypothetical protein
MAQHVRQIGGGREIILDGGDGHGRLLSRSFADEVSRLATDPALGFIPESAGPGAEALSSGLQGLFEDGAVFRLGAPAMIGGLTLERLDQIAGHVSDE